MKQLAAVIAGLSLLLSIYYAAPASAHTLKIDGTIAALLHTSPDDSPLSSVPVPYVLYFDDSTGNFSLAGCNCRVTVRQGSKVIANQTIYNLSQAIPGGTVTFPHPGVYEFTVTGTPIKPGAFQSFTLDYPLRVTQGPAVKQSSTEPRFFILGSAAIAAVVLVSAGWLYYSRKTAPVNNRRKMRRRT